MDKQIWLGKLLGGKVFLYLVANRVLFLIALYLLTLFIPFQNNVRFDSFLDFALSFGKRWDGNSYTFIADHGYVLTGPEKYFIVFPPFYPFIIKLLSLINISSVFAGTIISNLFFVISCMLFYKLLRKNYDEKISFWAIILVSIFPTSYFFSVAYPESLFLFLTVLTFYLSSKRNYNYSALAAGLASITRPFGIFLLPCLLIQIFFNENKNIRKMILPIIIFSIFPVYYLFLNYVLFSNFFAFSTFLKENWSKSYTFPWEGILSSWRRGIFTNELTNYKFLTGYGEAVASTLSWLSVPFAFRHWGLKSPYPYYILFATILFTSTGFILSAPRYLLSIFPFFILLTKAVYKNKIILSIWIILSLISLFYLSYQFAWGQWTF